MAKKKKSTAPRHQPISPERYLMSGQARRLPIHECFLNPNWQTIGLAVVVVSRIHVNKNISYGAYLIDTFCMGLKKTFYWVNRDASLYEKFTKEVYARIGLVRDPIDYLLVHNLVYGAIAYAHDFDLYPHPGWLVSQFLLAEDTDEIPLIELEFGKEERPCYVPGPYDNYGEVVRNLRTHAGEGNFDMIFADGDTYQNRLAQGLPYTLDELLPSGEYEEDEEDEFWEEDKEGDQQSAVPQPPVK